MKVQTISNLFNKPTQHYIRNNKSGASSNQIIENSFDKVSFTGNKIGFMKKIVKSEDLDQIMLKQMSKLNLTESSSRVISKIKTGDYTNILTKKIEVVNQRIQTLEDSLATYTKPKTIIEAE